MDEDKKFKDLLEEHRHVQLKGLLEGISESISKYGTDELALSINKQTDEIKNIFHALSEQIITNSSSDFVSKKIVPLFEGIKNQIVESNNKVIDAIENRAMPSSFKLVRGFGGYTESVDVIYKSAKELK